MDSAVGNRNKRQATGLLVVSLLVRHRTCGPWRLAKGKANAIMRLL